MDLTHLRIRRLELDDTRLLFTLANGIRIDEPIQAHRLLLKASPPQRAQWQITEDGFGVNWPAVAPPTPEGLLNMPELLWRRRAARVQAKLSQSRGRMDALSPGERELIALARLDADMNESGYARYFDRWDAATRSDALRGLAAMGAAQARQAIEGLGAVFERLEEDPNLLSIEDILDAMSDTDRQRVDGWEEVYYRRSAELARLGLTHYGVDKA
ncbi:MULTISPECIES: DMP19 family protein [Xanthomonas]|uniref:DUF4375 domain-containing protein n=1 Tax=Xanthomonas phaseoli pv. dieffenbachiae TaxID=92828 RepID=A0A1V9H4L5_9XANT|nr:DUF4375 domain-containing protein [Xanthomonas phaseoli]MBO9739732.1 DUF4375 domain-containing protein [Xanthomonas axonopodis pv. begoniae]MBO9768595.1 DUF4375 domain-containing protein [Xanthomonas phaseoli pv. dieffenbachiae]MBO9773813.1 DUF4375 domain-containing protein [Xanthomonas axonopodis pv. begoniae]MBO9777196.1 DUF4375 domain-containing protein [Xanthomonas phaseoli pv. dieffenbachiae]MBO9778856.1 DUF4375 domain-containing protein [Xanthomonas phaseoli pv. dieffenbachiae]